VNLRRKQSWTRRQTWRRRESWTRRKLDTEETRAEGTEIGKIRFSEIWGVGKP